MAGDVSLETIGANGRVYKRAFDHDEARALREADPKRWTYDALAAHFGVSAVAVCRVVNPAVDGNMRAAATAYLRAHRTPCKGGCGALVWTYANPDRTGLCPACHGAQRAADGVRDDELLCRICGEWKPDDDFGGKGVKARRGHRSNCRACETKARRAHRQANREHERAVERERYRKAQAA